MGQKLFALTLLDSFWADHHPLLSRFRSSDACALLRKAYMDLDTDLLYQSRVHGVGHIERTLLLGALIAWKKGLSTHDTELLLYACSYHDIGRINDWKDDDHGLRSAQKLEALRADDLKTRFTDAEVRMLYAMIRAHSLHVSRMAEAAERCRVPEEERERYTELASCLKDADNLDRVRIHDLNAKYLRNKVSSDLVPFAEALFRRYKETAV